MGGSRSTRRDAALDQRDDRPNEDELIGRSAAVLDTVDQISALLGREKQRLERIHGDLHRAYLRYRHLFDLVPVGCIALDERGAIKAMNDAAARLLAVDGDVQARFESFVHPEDRYLYQQHRAEVAKWGMTSPCEIRFCTSDSIVFYGRLDSLLVQDQGVLSSEHVMVLSDISGQRRAASLPGNVGALAEATVYSLADGVVTTDAHGRIIRLNTVAAAMSGWTCQEAQGKRLEEVLCLVDDTGRRIGRELVLGACTEPVELAEYGGYVSLVGRTGESRVIRGSIAPIRREPGGSVGLLLTFADATQSQRILQEVVYHASHDPLTGLLNRRELEKRLERAGRRTSRSGVGHVVCFVDLDHLKLVNDVAGHQAGDDLLKHVAGAIVSLLGDNDAVGRIGGDEFAILLMDCSLERGVTIADLIKHGVSGRPFLWEGHRFEMTVSIGVAAITPTTESWCQALGEADAACYEAKARGRNRLHVNGLSDGREAKAIDMVRPDHLRDALSGDLFEFLGQPIFAVSAPTETIAAYEMLLRLPGRPGRLHLPADFLPLAERYGLICALDRWVLRTSFRCRLAREQHAFSLSLNISAQSLSDPSLLDFVQRELADSGFRGDRLWLEVTEGAAIHNIKQARAFMQEMRHLGCHIALDDFGKGMSSFTYLQNFPVSLVKIDRSFVHNLKTDSFSRSVVRAIAQVAMDCGLRTVGEGVENASALEVLQELGVDYAQGFALGRPVSLREAEQACGSASSSPADEPARRTGPPTSVARPGGPPVSAEPVT